MVNADDIGTDGPPEAYKSLPPARKVENTDELRRIARI